MDPNDDALPNLPFPHLPPIGRFNTYQEAFNNINAFSAIEGYAMTLLRSKPDGSTCPKTKYIY
jgi:hypothetical protein